MNGNITITQWFTRELYRNVKKYNKRLLLTEENIKTSIEQAPLQVAIGFIQILIEDNNKLYKEIKKCTQH